MGVLPPSHSKRCHVRGDVEDVPRECHVGVVRRLDALQICMQVSLLRINVGLGVISGCRGTRRRLELCVHIRNVDVTLAILGVSPGAPVVAKDGSFAPRRGI